MSVQQIINVLLAIGVDAAYYCIGEPSDFYSDATSKSYESTFMRDLHEEAPVNSVGGGNIAGTREAGDDPPVRRKKKKYIYQKGLRKTWMPSDGK